MNGKNGSEFSALEIRVQLISLTFSLLPQKCPNHPWARRQVLGINRSVISAKESEMLRIPWITGIAHPREEEGR